nr:oligoribonuclease [Leucobacter ruminantium]
MRAASTPCHGEGSLAPEHQDQHRGATVSNTPAEQIVWIDCEMTGLDVDRDGLCEIAVIVTDFDLTPLDPGFEVVINPGPDALEQMNDFVRSMHAGSGLLPRIEAGVSVEEAERQVLDYVNRFVGPGRRPLVAGNTIGMDRRFIAKYMPVLEERLHYRSIDVSTIKELARRWYVPAYFNAPEKRGGHRALADIAESIQELAYFRETVMLEAPGPDKTVTAEIARRMGERYAPFIDGEPQPPR